MNTEKLWYYYRLYHNCGYLIARDVFPDRRKKALNGFFIITWNVRPFIGFEKCLMIYVFKEIILLKVKRLRVKRFLYLTNIVFYYYSTAPNKIL